MVTASYRLLALPEVVFISPAGTPFQYTCDIPTAMSSQPQGQSQPSSAIDTAAPVRYLIYPSDNINAENIRKLDAAIRKIAGSGADVERRTILDGDCTNWVALLSLQQAEEVKNLDQVRELIPGTSLSTTS